MGRKRLLQGLAAVSLFGFAGGATILIASNSSASTGAVHGTTTSSTSTTTTAPVESTTTTAVPAPSTTTTGPPPSTTTTAPAPTTTTTARPVTTTTAAPPTVAAPGTRQLNGRLRLGQPRRAPPRPVRPARLDRRLLPHRRPERDGRRQPGLGGRLQPRPPRRRPGQHPHAADRGRPGVRPADQGRGRPLRRPPAGRRPDPGVRRRPRQPQLDDGRRPDPDDRDLPRRRLVTLTPDGGAWGRGPTLRRRTGLGPRPGRRSRQDRAVEGASP